MLEVSAGHHSNLQCESGLFPIKFGYLPQNCSSLSSVTTATTLQGHLRARNSITHEKLMGLVQHKTLMNFGPSE